MGVSATPYTIRFTADPVQLTFFRFGFGRWLQELGWPEAERQDLILAVSEACTNSVEHAYVVTDQGDVEVSARLLIDAEGRRVAVTVRDWGRWTPEHGEPGGVDQGRPGRGLVLIRECVDRVRVRHDERGTAVVMWSRPVPFPAAPAPRAAPEGARAERAQTP